MPSLNSNICQHTLSSFTFSAVFLRTLVSQERLTVSVTEGHRAGISWIEQIRTSDTKLCFIVNYAGVVPDALEQKVPIASRTSGVFAGALLVKSMVMRVEEWEFILRIESLIYSSLFSSWAFSLIIFIICLSR